MKSSILSSLSVVMGFIVPSLVFAQAGSGAGNGGHPAEVAEMKGANGARLESWYTVKQDLIKGLELGRHSELTFEAGDTADSFKTSAMNALQTTVLDFGDQKIEITGARRACKNWVEASGVGRIYCDLPYLVETMKLFDSEAQYRFIAHEYLSVAGLEPNEYGSSSYFYSSQISKSLKTVESKRWGVIVAATFDPMLNVGFECTVREGIRKEKHFIFLPDGRYALLDLRLMKAGTLARVLIRGQSEGNMDKQGNFSLYHDSKNGREMQLYVQSVDLDLSQLPFRQMRDGNLGNYTRFLMSMGGSILKTAPGNIGGGPAYCGTYTGFLEEVFETKNQTRKTFWKRNNY